MSDLHFRIPGKCILAGEHAVLRGSPALVLPVRARYLELEYEQAPPAHSSEANKAHGLRLRIESEAEAIWDVLFWGVMEKALEKLGLNKDFLRGDLRLQTNLSLGAGMGASACLCVAVARLFVFWGKLKEAHVYDFARSLEDIFHGESSGVDIAVALEAQGIRFVRNASKPEPMGMRWQPRLYLSYTGGKGITSECVAQVKALFDRDFERAKDIDDQMQAAVEQMQQALQSDDSQASREQFAAAMRLADACFADWGLLGGGLMELRQQVLELGALAVKPTGSGNGGYLLSLWDKEPPPSEDIDWIAVHG